MAPVDPVEESEVKLSQNGSASGHAESPTGSPHAGNPASDSVTWASTKNLQDLVAPPDMHVYNSIAGGSGHASTAFIDNSNSNYEGASDEDRDSNRPGTYEFLKYNTRHLTAEVLFCASMGNLRGLKMVLNKAGKTIKTENYADYDKRTPLHIAASDGSVFVTNWLLEQGVDMNPLDRWLMTPLEGAVFGDHQDIVQMMVQAGGMIMDRTTETLVPLEESHLASASASEAKPVLTAGLMAWEVPDEELAERTEIGAGAFGVVLKTRWRGTVVAMKQLHRHLHHDEVAKAEFRTELKLMRQLHHPHIVQFLGTSVEPVTGLVSLIFEFMHFGSLDQMFHKAQVPLFKGHAVELALEVARGMSYLHGRKPQPVIHHVPRQPESPTKIQAVEAAPPTRHLHAVHQLPELDPPPRHDHLDVWEQVPEVTRGQRRTRHDHDERFAQLTQAREDSGELTERWVVDVLVDDIEAELGQMLAGRPVAVEGFPKGP